MNVKNGPVAFFGGEAREILFGQLKEPWLALILGELALNHVVAIAP